MLLVGRYQQAVVQDSIRGKELIRNYIEHYKTENLNKIFFSKNFFGSEFAIIESPYTEDEELIIKYASTNFEKYTNYTASELEGMLLTQIIPEPIKSIHSLLVEKSVGRLLRLKVFTDVFMLKKDSSLLPISLALKVSYSLTNGFSYLAGF